jgi:RHS repeat-associated protein
MISREVFCYAAVGQRIFKITVCSNTERPGKHQVRYQPRLEICRYKSNNHDHGWQVIGVADMQILRSRSEHLQLRYSVAGLNHHRLLEVDGAGQVISREDYYPFGGTARWATRRRWALRNKTLRYGGKERDLTGLIYYGFRYYLPWLLRWLNPDPAGDVDGLNLLQMCRNNPATGGDVDGRMFKKPSQPKAQVEDKPLISDALFNDVWELEMMQSSRGSYNPEIVTAYSGTRPQPASVEATTSGTLSGVLMQSAPNHSGYNPGNSGLQRLSPEEFASGSGTAAAGASVHSYRSEYAAYQPKLSL